MAKVLVLGGGFGGVVAAERLAKLLAPEHQITLVSRSPRFVFYPALVRLAFGGCEPEDVSFDLRESMLDRRVRFIQGEVARVDPRERKVVFAHGEVVGDLPYDYLVFALGRRLATERVKGFYEHAHHLLTVEAALKFGKAAREFSEGHAVIGYCEGSRLAVPVYETAIALARSLEERGVRGETRISVVTPELPGERMEGDEMRLPLREALDAHGIDFWPNFPINRVTADRVHTSGGPGLPYDLLMLLPPFAGAGAVMYQEITDAEGFIVVERSMRVAGVERMYAVGDCVGLPGPKMAHMAVNQAETAAANLAAEIEGRAPEAVYRHEIKLVMDEGGADSIYLHKDLDGDGAASVRRGRFWGWAKRVQERYWEALHS
jgi:sulfide:quinone oxidoreductase